MMNKGGGGRKREGALMRLGYETKQCSGKFDSVSEWAQMQLHDGSNPTEQVR